MSTRPVIHYLVTRPDGTVPPTSGHAAEYATWQGEPIPTVNIADHLGRLVAHPSPGKRWFDDRPFSYFRLYTRPGEALERVEWPARLWIVEPRGETGNWGAPHYPYWVLCHQLKVVEETDIWRAFGHRGETVLDVLQRQLPDLARQWATEWAADPDGTRQRYGTWTERLSEIRVDWWVYWKARYSRRSAAATVAETLARTAAEKAALDVGADKDATAAVSHRAWCLIAGHLLHDRLRRPHEREIRALLLGAGLDSPQPALA